MGWGGARPGSGRKPKLEKNALAINRAEKQIRDRLPEVIEHLFELAEGVTVEGTDQEGNTKVYKMPPDRVSCMYLVNRIMGKPEVRVKTKHSGTVTWVSRAQQLEAMADPVALELICELDARLCAAALEGDDGGEMGPYRIGGEMGLPTSLGTLEPPPYGNGSGPD